MAIDGKTVGLALSGGGFRAALFGLGSLWRLNDAGLLGRLDCITSVSGGSIVSGVLAHGWKQLQFVGGRASNFEAVVAQPIRKFCAQEYAVEPGLKGLLTPVKLVQNLAHDVDVSATLKGWITPGMSAADFLIGRYREELFGEATLKDLPQPGDGAPLFIFYATNLQTGRSFRLQRDKVADYRIGESTSLVVPLAKAVAASSAFPPVFSPVVLEADVDAWTDTPVGQDGKRQTLEDRELLGKLRQRVLLADGGIYDNMGLQRLTGDTQDRVDIVLASDAGAPFEIEEKLHEDYVSQLGRVRDILIDQTRALRKRWLIQEFIEQRRKGAYWGVATDIDAYHAPDALASFTPGNQKLDEVPTRLSGLDHGLQVQLINWGYALCDAALRAPKSSAGLPVAPVTALPAS